jgi:alpha 1,3-glucosidase
MDWHATLYYYKEGRDFTTPNTWFWNDMNEISAHDAIEITVPKDAKTIDGYEAREVHSLYGLAQVAATYKGLRKRDEIAGLTPQRPWVLSRSWFAGSAKYTWVWTGDNENKWSDMVHSIAMVTVAGLNGMPFIGEDLGGFMHSAGPTIMARWCQLGAWIYPFFRNHCSYKSAYREPYEYTGDAYTQIMNAIHDRYMLLAVWYTHSMYTLRDGRSPIVPLWYEWPEVEAFHDNDHEALLADAFLVVPVLDDKTTSVKIAKPPGTWYELWTGKTIKDGEEKQVTMFDIPVYLREGRIVPLYINPGDGAIATISQPLTLMIAGDENHEAEGFIYLDDGVTFAHEKGEFIHRKLTLKNGVLSSSKVDPLEKGPPEFLKDVLIVNLTYYQVKPDGSTNVTNLSGLQLRLVDEWSFDIGVKSVGYGKEESLKLVVGVCVGVVVVAVCVGVGVLVVRRRREVEVKIMTDQRRYV